MRTLIRTIVLGLAMTLAAPTVFADDPPEPAKKKVVKKTPKKVVKKAPKKVVKKAPKKVVKEAPKKAPKKADDE